MDDTQQLTTDAATSDTAAPEAAPQYILFSATESLCGEDGAQALGRWRFMLGRPEGEVLLDEQDVEPEVTADRLDLLSVIRGLEALSQPSRVTLFTSSHYVQRGLRFGLERWKRSAWCWERFGRMVPIKHEDLWRRLDQALQYHSLECRYWRFDSHQTHCEPIEPLGVHDADAA